MENTNYGEEGGRGIPETEKGVLPTSDDIDRRLLSVEIWRTGITVLSRITPSLWANRRLGVAKSPQKGQGRDRRGSWERKNRKSAVIREGKVRTTTLKLKDRQRFRPKTAREVGRQKKSQKIPPDSLSGMPGTMVEENKRTKPLAKREKGERGWTEAKRKNEKKWGSKNKGE